jgi:hypothetical protein
MDKEFDKPAPDLPEETTETLDPTLTWSPQPTRVYDLQDAAAREGAGDGAPQTAAAVAEADRLMVERAGPDNEMQSAPFRVPLHEVEHTVGDVKTDLDLDIPRHSGQGQS